MVKVRQDAWSHEDDLLLAETVLRHIREGSTQLNAFEEVGDALNRTAAACGFRWNAEVRQNYEKAVDLAKRQRKERKRAKKQTHSEKLPEQGESSQLPITVESPSVQTTSDTVNDSTLDGIIQQLETLKTQMRDQSDIDIIKTDNQQLREENDLLKEELQSLKAQYNSLQEDYQTFITIMDRARKMMILEDGQESPAFQMEKNGNLQQIAK
ncbi:RsfA family transcriptional regulator [Alkalibacillus salilacus]|uniref:Prespore-specific regulator n=1 Tax=Alkalibacillus salilacus TaxID=284582 RepID=A0ABT9VCN1_9BACI|nr:RsfA family transcriptional regulator [Alkalibacillus salilacus]MDQ0158722.1 prespore-specific regulator [Alkalibacillus salilacus]